MLDRIDNFLNRITMYRLVLYYLCGLIIAAVFLGWFGFLPYSPLNLLLSAVIFIILCESINRIFAWIFRAHPNVESSYITALILSLIVAPTTKILDVHWLGLAAWTALFAVGSKYLLAINKKHIFNPAALAVVVTFFLFQLGAGWWVGNTPMLGFVLIGGLLVVRKIQRFDLVISFVLMALLSLVVTHLDSLSTVLAIIKGALLSTPLIFFGCIMLTEPATTPPTRAGQIIYGILVGLLFGPTIHWGTIYMSPELALILGNIYAYIVSPKRRLILKLQQKTEIASGIYDFIFEADGKINFRAGQYLEWTLDHKHPDSRGNRRYFTIASAPTEERITIGVKFYPQPSSFKTALKNLAVGDTISAAGLAGDFTLPRETSRELVFIAGGIGITPFRSMIKQLLDNASQQPITLLYCVNTAADIAYKDLFELAEKKLPLKVKYVIGQIIDEKFLKTEIPNYSETTFYLSGPRSMVTTFDHTLKTLGVRQTHIKRDFFPGFA